MASNEASPWKDLELVATPNRGEYRVVESTTTVRGEAVLYGLDAEGRRHLFVPADPEATINPDRRSAGVHIVRQELEGEGAVKPFITVSCRKGHLNSVFGHLAAETAQRLNDSDDDPYTTCRLVLARWRELIDREVPQVLSVEAQAGLFAELIWLERLVAENIDAVAIWTGPDGAVHDFRTPNAALEVKATLSRNSSAFKINGLRQLEAPAECELWIAAMRIEEDPSSGRSLPDAVQKLRAGGVDALLLTRKLMEAGYDSRDAEHYASRRFRVSELRVYEIDDEFPRLTPDSFIGGAPPDRVSNVEYIIDLAGEPPTPLSDEEVDTIVADIGRAP